MLGDTGRNIVDNVVIVQEILHSMKSKRTFQWMAVKIGLEKAYDRVHWDLVKTLLKVTVSDGNIVHCWEAAWVPNVGPLINHVSTYVNVVSNCKATTGLSAAGGVIRDETGSGY
ncbi:hypothetical protein J1N35_012020 [Gossypium stocksii]|uniref:Reverse transcriptase domain-containing protein n=1 Tax=Gossypium stocksii TaxID=47602 RepID=A0A9D4AC01_9ROSI|nr:hypothetical protein J1N35_012020 [Gossypium stocksii]